MSARMSAFDPKPFLANVSQRPGVYRMIAADGEVLYVGKARNLKNRADDLLRRQGAWRARPWRWSRRSPTSK